MQKLCLVSNDMLFAEGIRLVLSPYPVLVDIWAGKGELPLADTYLWDMDTYPHLPSTDRPVIHCAWKQEKPADFSGIWLDRPFRGARLRALLGIFDGKEQNVYPYPNHSNRTVLIGSEVIKLSACEFRLFCCLYEAKGQYVSREALHKAVWEGQGDVSVVNVYIHYLRRKLEKNDLRLFHSARGRGYALCEKGGF